jgi:excisionase family DNA binding protein
MLSDTSPHNRPFLVTMRDAQYLLSLDDNTIYKLLRSGEIEYTNIGRCMRIYYDSLLAYVERVRKNHDNTNAE